MSQDQVFVPRTRSQLGLPPLNPDGENHLGTSVSQEVMKELREAIGDSPIGALFGAGSYLVRPSNVVRNWHQRLHLFQLFGWPMYLIRNAASQKRYPKGSNRSLNSVLSMRSCGC